MPFGAADSRLYPGWPSSGFAECGKFSLFHIVSGSLFQGVSEHPDFSLHFAAGHTEINAGEISPSASTYRGFAIFSLQPPLYFCCMGDSGRNDHSPQGLSAACNFFQYFSGSGDFSCSSGVRANSTCSGRGRVIQGADHGHIHIKAVP